MTPIQPVERLRPVERFWQRFHRMDESRFGILLLLPTLLLLVVFLVLPIVYALYMSLHQIELTISSQWKFVGLANYGGLVTDSRVLETIPRTLYFAGLNVAVTTLLSLCLALVLNEQFAGRNWIRVFILLPWAVAPVVSGVMWRYLFHQRYGLINALLLHLGLIDRYVVWFDDPTFALSIASFATAWKALPFSTLILLASMQSIPESLFRASKMDGANLFHRFRYVTLPHLRPTLVFVVVLQIITSLQAFDVIFTLTRGGPGQGTVVLNYLTFINAFERLSIGNAATLAILLALLIVLLSVLSIYLAKDRSRRGKE
jgi:multiple sugar transport system permease protein